MMKTSRWTILSLALLACGPEGTEDEHHDEHEEALTEVTLSSIAVERGGIEVGVVTRTPIGGGVGVPAELEADPAYTAHVASVVASRITSVEVRVGDRVEVGQLLASIASSDVSASRGALSGARVRRDAARAARDRQASLVEAGIGARRALLEAEAELASAEAEMRGLSGGLAVVGRGGGSGIRVIAPIAGVITQTHATRGEVIEAGAPLFTITDPAHLWVVGQVPELDLSAAREGASATLTVAAFPNERFSGHLDFVAPALDESSRTLPVRFALDLVDGEVDPRLRAGLFGRLEIAPEGAGPEALVVPDDALSRIDGEDVVFVASEDGLTFRPVVVEIGRRDGDRIELLTGVEEGTRIVTRGAFALRSHLVRGELSEHEH
jgi:cobalt-zinc-cadmium efflux system membrane fusion protein